MFRKQSWYELLDRMGGGGVDPEAVMREMDALRWLDEAFYHAWKMEGYLHVGDRAAGTSNLKQTNASGTW